MSAGAPLVAVVTPVYNGGDFVGECVGSVRAQTYQNWVQIVADNASTDGTAAAATEAAEGDARVVVRTYDRHVGMMASWNRALAAVPEEAEWIKFVFGDDMLLPECLSAMVEAGADPAVVLVAGYRLEGAQVHPSGVPLTETRLPGREMARRILLDTIDMVGYPTHVLLRARAVREAGFRFPEEPWPRGLDDPPAWWAIDKDPFIGFLQRGDAAFVHRLLTYQRKTDEGGTVTAERLRMQLPGDLGLLVRCGPGALDHEDLAGRARELTRAYSVLLLKQTLKARTVRDAEFRRHHAVVTRELATGLRHLGVSGPSRTLGAWARALTGVERFTGARRAPSPQ